LADLQAANLIRADIDLMLEANAIVALVDGIGTGSVIYPEQFSAEQQKYLVRRHINVLLIPKTQPESLPLTLSQPIRRRSYLWDIRLRDRL
jgi:BetI-type transcriptional repressor, C-terminal